MKDDFLPADYSEPNVSKYMSLEEGENRFRILPAKEGKTTLIMGWEYWKTIKTPEGDKRKPVRVHANDTVPVKELELSPFTGELDLPKFFWAMAVYNYQTKSVQILEIKQKSIRKPIESLSRNAKWGSPTGYDLIVNQIVEGKKTSYTVQPDPKEEISKDILDEYTKVTLNLDALFDGADPFNSNEEIGGKIADDELEIMSDEEMAELDKAFPN